MLRPREAAGGRIQGSRAGTDGSHAPPVVGIGFPAWGRGVSRRGWAVVGDGKNSEFQRPPAFR